jgi:hypothetical protein
VFDWIYELIVLIFLNYGIYLPSNMIRRYRHNVSYALALSTVHSYSVCNSSQSLVTTQQSTCKSQLYLAVGNLIVWMLWHRSYHCNFCKPYVLQWLIGYINLLAVIFSKKIKEFVILNHGS